MSLDSSKHAAPAQCHRIIVDFDFCIDLNKLSFWSERRERRVEFPSTEL